MKLEDFYPYILAEVAGCPDPIVKNALVFTAIEFCRQTMAWTQDMDPEPLESNVAEYSITPPVDSVLFNVLEVWVGDRQLEPKTSSAISRLGLSASASDPLYYNQSIERGSLSIFPAPAEPNGATFSVRAVFIPAVTATTLPDFMGRFHMELLAAGTKARLLGMVGTPWNNDNAAFRYSAEFLAGIANTRMAETHGRVSGSLSIQSRTFG